MATISHQLLTLVTSEQTKNEQTDTQPTYSQTDRQTDTQTDRQTDRHTQHTHTSVRLFLAMMNSATAASRSANLLSLVPPIHTVSRAHTDSLVPDTDRQTGDTHTWSVYGSHHTMSVCLCHHVMSVCLIICVTMSVTCLSVSPCLSVSMSVCVPPVVSKGTV